MEPLLIGTIFISFFCTYFLLPYWIKGAHLNGLVGRDVHKNSSEKVAEGGGLIVLCGTTLGILLYIAINTFIFNSGNSAFLIKIFALLSVLFLASLIGIVDDLLGWKKGLTKSLRILAMFFAAIPLIVINAGNSSIILPIFGQVNLGILYALLIVPIGVVGATTTYNFLAGYNGLESSQGIIILIGLAITTYLTGNSWITIISLCMAAALLAFYIFNKYPSKVFPGDILTYSVGAMIAGIAILGNIERIVILFFIPYILETILKLRGRLKKESFAKLNSDGSLEQPYEKIYGLEHLAIKILKKIKSSKKVYEVDVVRLINLFQILIILTTFLIFF